MTSSAMGGLSIHQSSIQWTTEETEKSVTGKRHSHLDTVNTYVVKMLLVAVPNVTDEVDVNEIDDEDDDAVSPSFLFDTSLALLLSANLAKQHASQTGHLN